MKPLKTNHRILTWLCACPVDPPNKWESVFFAIFTGSIFVLNVSSTGAAAAYFLRFFSVDLESCLYCLLQIAATTSLSYMMIVVFLKPHKINNIFVRLTKICNSCKKEYSFRFLEEADEKSEWLWGVYSKYLMGGFFANMIIAVMMSGIACLMLAGHLDVNLMHHPYRLIFPWDQQTPVGYVLEIMFSLFAVETYFLVHGAYFLLFISMCWYHQAFLRLFQMSLKTSDRIDRTQIDHKFLCKSIQFHIMVKNWFLDSADAYSPLILVRQICTIGILACAVFQLDLQLKHLDSSIFALFMAIIDGVSDLYLYCYFGKLATDSHTKMAECLYETNWPDLPVPLQKYFILMISNIQKPLYYHGFGIAVLDLEAFTQFMRAVFTYYMIFKTVTE